MDFRDTHLIQPFIDIVLNLPVNFPFLKSCIKILGRFGKWFAAHQSTLKIVITSLKRALNCEQSIADVAAESLKEICRGCKELMIVYFGDFYQIFSNMNHLNLSDAGELEVIKAICEIISNMPRDQLLIAMRELCNQQLIKIYQFRSVNAAKMSDQLAEIFDKISSDSHKDATAKVIIEIWPFLRKMMKSQSSEILKKIIECLKLSVLRCGVKLLPIFEEMIEEVILHCNAET